MIEKQKVSIPVPLTLAQMLSEMDQAITDEIEKLSAAKPIKHSAVDGKLLSEGNGQYVYQFTLSEPWEPQDEGQLSIASESAQGIACSVVTSIGTVLTIATDRPLPPEALRQIDLYDDSTELLKRLKEALKQIDEGPAMLGSKCFGLVDSAKYDYPGEIQCGPVQFREKQMKAARLALGGEVTFIVGPPGTGKTFTCTQIDRLQKELDPLERAEAQRISSLRQQQSQHQTNLAQLGNEEKRWSLDLAPIEAQIVEQEQVLAQEQLNKNTSLAQLVEARAMSSMKRFFKGVKLEKLELKMAAAGRAVEELHQFLQGLHRISFIP